MQLSSWLPHGSLAVSCTDANLIPGSHPCWPLPHSSIRHIGGRHGNHYHRENCWRDAFYKSGNPSQFVFPAPQDWFHNNAVAYNRADDSLIVSGREDFVLCIDYETGAIKWILGDPAKAWYQFPSLKQYALTLSPGSLSPIGQHAVSIAYNQDLLLFDNGTNSFYHDPPRVMRDYASPRRYHIDAVNKIATEVWN